MDKVDYDAFKSAFDRELKKHNLVETFDENEYAHIYEAFVTDMEVGLHFDIAMNCALYYNTSLGGKLYEL